MTNTNWSELAQTLAAAEERASVTLADYNRASEEHRAAMAAVEAAREALAAPLGVSRGPGRPPAGGGVSALVRDYLRKKGTATTAEVARDVGISMRKAIKNLSNQVAIKNIVRVSPGVYALAPSTAV